MIGKLLVRGIVGLGVGIVGALGPFWLYGRAKAEAAELQAKVSALQVEIATREREIQSLRGAIDEQNAGIQRWKEAAVKQSLTVRRAEKLAEQQRSNGEAKAATILQRKAPATTAEVLAEAHDLALWGTQQP